VQDANLLVGALSNQPEYLRNKQTDNNLVIDYKDWQIPLGRVQVIRNNLRCFQFMVPTIHLMEFLCTFDLHLVFHFSDLS
jgi:hypothetical protein